MFFQHISFLSISLFMMSSVSFFWRRSVDEYFLLCFFISIFIAARRINKRSFVFNPRTMRRKQQWHFCIYKSIFVVRKNTCHRISTLRIDYFCRYRHHLSALKMNIVASFNMSFAIKMKMTREKEGQITPKNTVAPTHKHERAHVSDESAFRSNCWIISFSEKSVERKTMWWEKACRATEVDLIQFNETQNELAEKSSCSRRLVFAIFVCLLYSDNF